MDIIINDNISSPCVSYFQVVRQCVKIVDDELGKEENTSLLYMYQKYPELRILRPPSPTNAKLYLRVLPTLLLSDPTLITGWPFESGETYAKKKLIAYTIGELPFPKATAIIENEIEGSVKVEIDEISAKKMLTRDNLLNLFGVTTKFIKEYRTIDGETLFTMAIQTNGHRRLPILYKMVPALISTYNDDFTSPIQIAVEREVGSDMVRSLVNIIESVEYSSLLKELIAHEVGVNNRRAIEYFKAYRYDISHLEDLIENEDIERVKKATGH